MLTETTKLTGIGARQALSSIWNSFEQEFSSDKNDIRALSKRVKYEIALAKTSAYHQDQQLRDIDQQQARESRRHMFSFARKANNKLENIRNQQLQEDRRKARKSYRNISSIFPIVISMLKPP